MNIFECLPTTQQYFWKYFWKWDDHTSIEGMVVEGDNVVDNYGKYEKMTKMHDGEHNCYCCLHHVLCKEGYYPVVHEDKF